MNGVITISKKYYSHGKNREVYINGNGRIVYRYLTGHVTAYCTFHSVLYEILNDPGLSPFIDENGGIRFELQKKTSIIKKCKLSLLAQACYDGHITTAEKWQSEYKKYRNWMNNFKYQVDHADSNQLNCTIYNLSVMSRKLNGGKSDLTARVKQPVICYSGHFGNEYRIRTFWPNLKNKKTGHRGVWLKLKCSEAADYVSCIREIEELEIGYGKPSWTIGDNGDYERAQANSWIKGCWKEGRRSVTKDNIEISMNGQEQMAWMFDCEFIPCRAGEVCLHFEEEVAS